MRDENTVLELIGSLYEAAACPVQWQPFLHRLVEHTASEKAIITLHSLRDNVAMIHESLGLASQGAQDFNAYYASRNPVTQQVLELTRAHGSWYGLSRSLVGEREYRSSEYYNDFGRKHGSYWVAVCTTMHAEDAVTALSLVRSERAPAFDVDTADLMGVLVPHLGRVLAIHRTMDSLRSAAGAFAAASDALEAAMIAVDGKGEILVANGRADDLLRQGDGLKARGRHLLASDARETRALTALMQSAAATGAGRGVHPGGHLLIHRPCNSPLQVSIVPFRSAAKLDDALPCALVLVRDPDARPASRAAILSTLYGLTPAECRLADLLSAGPELSSAAEVMRITYGTARFMLKNIFSKTSTHRQPELMRLLLGLPTIATSGAVENKDATAEPVRRTTAPKMNLDPISER